MNALQVSWLQNHKTIICMRIFQLFSFFYEFQDWVTQNLFHQVHKAIKTVLMSAELKAFEAIIIINIMVSHSECHIVSHRVTFWHWKSLCNIFIACKLQPVAWKLYQLGISPVSAARDKTVRETRWTVLGRTPEKTSFSQWII